MGAGLSSLGARLRVWRERAGLSQEALAERANVGVATLAALEHDRRRRPHPHTLASVADALGLTADERAALLDAAHVDARRSANGAVDVDRHSNLPAARLQLYGRDTEIQRLAARVLSVPGRLVTITGSGGIGKTTLALAVARQLLAEFQDGVWLADLASMARSGAVSQALASALGVRESQAVTIEEALQAFLHNRQLLLVIDNCEHMVDACAALVDDLLDQSPGLRILATSREPLRVSGEVVHQLQPLSVPATPTDAALDQLMSYASVELFLDRARAVRRDLELTACNADAVAEICRRLDGIPLARELAATRISGLTLEHIADRLRASFGVLIAHSRSRPARHQTLRATLEWSHALLSPIEQAVFRRLGALIGGWSMAAAEAICAGDDLHRDDVADVLGVLVDKSLVVLEQRDGEARYRFLEPVREYAQAQLAASAESQATHDRHRAYFVAFAEQAEAELHRADQAAWMRRLDRDLDNVRLAMRLGRDHADPETVLRIAGALTWYLWVRGHLREGLEWVDGLLEGHDVSHRARMLGLRVAAMLLGALGRSAEADVCAMELMALAERIGNSVETARAATLAGLERYRAAEIERALPLFDRALRDARLSGDPMMLANALINLGAILGELGNTGRAEELYREGLARFQHEGDVWGIAYATNHLAALARQRGDHAHAAALSAEAVRLLTSLGDRFYLILAVEDLARARLDGRRFRSAVRLLGVAYALREASGALLSPFSRTENARDMARVRSALGAPAFDQAWADGEHDWLTVLRQESDVGPANLPAQAPRDDLGGPGGTLTAREREVVRLIGHGYTNRRIAEELVVTAGTAGIHVEHILRKLDLQSRHQVADWAKANGLVPT